MDHGLKIWPDFYIRASLNCIGGLVSKSPSLKEMFSMKIFWFIFLTQCQGKHTTLTAINGFPLRCWDAQTIELFACAPVWILSFLIVYRLCYSQSSRIYSWVYIDRCYLLFFQNCHTVTALFMNNVVANTIWFWLQVLLNVQLLILTFVQFNRSLRENKQHMYDSRSIVSTSMQRHVQSLWTIKTRSFWYTRYRQIYSFSNVVAKLRND